LTAGQSPLLARDVCPVADVAIMGNYAAIETTAECEQHNPRLLAEHPVTGELYRVNSFMRVSVAVTYACLIPRDERGLALKVDDAYGVI
jgi:hypothetical protein